MGNCESCAILGIPPKEDAGNKKLSEVKNVADFLHGVSLFKRVPDTLQPKLAEACEHVQFSPKQVIIRQGDPGHEFFVIKSGEAAVYHDDGAAAPRQVARLGAGDHFGETSLLRDVPRSATIRAETQIDALKITREKFEDLGLRDKLDFPSRKAVGAGVARRIATKPPTARTSAETIMLEQAIRKNPNLNQILSGLDDRTVTNLVSMAWKETVPQGTKLIEEGDLNADYFYVVQEGHFEIAVKKSSRGAALSMESAVENVGQVYSGGSFGELALLYIAPRAASVTAAADSTVWVIDRNHFKKTLADAGKMKLQEHIKHLEHVDTLAGLSRTEKEQVANCLVEMVFQREDIVIEQGDEGESFYILYEGEVLIIKDGKEETRLKATEDKAKVFGERALLKDEPRAATVKVLSEKAYALKLDRMSFRLLRTRMSPPPKEEDIGMQSMSLARAGNIRFKDLKVIGLLGCGGFGAVELVQHLPTQKTFALKALSKGYVVQCGMQQASVSEKNIQMMCDSPFIIKLQETYNSDQMLYFLLECALGGELYNTYNRRRLHGSAPHAKFYAAGVVLAFEHMHALKIMYRDLKPENLLLNAKGHVKLTDMGLAKVTPGKTFTTCGTPDYFAPEVIASTGHTQAVDWWTLGIFYYELMAGNPPFEAQSPMQTYRKVMKGIDKVQFPPACEGLLEAVIKGLLQEEPSSRLCMRPGGAKNLKKQAWYKGFDWDAFGTLRMEPPFKPSVKDPPDAGNFNAKSADKPPVVPYQDDRSGWDKDFATSF
mmetsp:Transcript_4700/g.11405  ORF Transcript_4700/g.11405 Transcript_4700/m.11405 type:complete len:772 (-) Transcript_4700:196-2511(-)